MGQLRVGDGEANNEFDSSLDLATDELPEGILDLLFMWYPVVVASSSADRVRRVSTTQTMAVTAWQLHPSLALSWVHRTEFMQGLVAGPSASSVKAICRR